MSAATAFVASLLAALLIVIVRAQVAPEGGYGGLRQAPLEAVLTAVVGPLRAGAVPPLDGKVDRARSRVGLARGPRNLGGAIAMEVAGQDAELPEIRRRARHLAVIVLVLFLRDRGPAVLPAGDRRRHASSG